MSSPNLESFGELKSVCTGEQGMKGIIMVVALATGEQGMKGQTYVLMCTLPCFGCLDSTFWKKKLIVLQ